MDPLKEESMSRLPFSAPRVGKLLLLALGASFIFLVLFAPIYSIYAGPVWSSAQEASGLISSSGIRLPLILHNHPRQGGLLITEVLYNPAGREPDGEWVELYNSGSQTLHLSGHKIGDQALPGCCEGMLAFPAEAVIKAGQVIVIANKASAFQAVYGFKPDYEMENSDPAVPLLTRYTYWAERSVELTNSGDELLLLGPENEIVDSLSWGSSSFAFDPPVPNVAEAYSLERYPPYIDTDSARDWRKRESPQPGEVDLTPPTPIPVPSVLPPVNPTSPLPVLPTPFGGKLLLSEFMYDPSGSEPDQEWIEIYNAGPQALQLQDFKLGDEETKGGSEGMLRFPVGAVLEPGQAVVVAHKGSAFKDFYHEFPDFEIVESLPDIPNMLSYPAWGTASLNLNNDGDELHILDGRDDLIDAISYGSSLVFLSPSIPLSEPGCSLERYPSDQDNDQAWDWRQQCLPSPGQAALIPTPQPTPVPVLVINEIHHAPDLLYGDANGDGVIRTNEDEFVEIANLTGVPVDLTGWRLSDGLTSRHIFSSPSWIPHDCSLVLFGGGDPEGDFGCSQVQISSSGTLSLNDSGDTLRLYDAAGNLVLSLIYDGQYQGEQVSGQSLTRSPDLIGEEFVPHMIAPGGARYSPGTRLDGTPFSGCGCVVPALTYP
jgi:hypothetical protein